MTEEKKQATLAQLKQIPKPIHTAVLVSIILGLVSFSRVLVHAYAADLSMSKAVWYGLLMLGWFWIFGVSLYGRSRWSYLALTLFAILPLLGNLALSLHLLRMAIEGSLAAKWREALHCATALLQLITTGVLLWYLLNKQTRDFIWKPTVKAVTK